MNKFFDGRKGKRFSHKIVSNLRIFGFHIGNETILATTKWEFRIILDTPPDALGKIIKLKLFREYEDKGNRQNNSEKIETDLSSSELIGQYIESLKDKTEFTISFDKLHSVNRKNWRDVIEKSITQPKLH